MKEVIKIGRKCKCRICTNKLTTDVAYCVKVNGRNQYYCSEEEYNKVRLNKDKYEKWYIIKKFGIVKMKKR